MAKSENVINGVEIRDSMAHLHISYISFNYLSFPTVPPFYYTSDVKTNFFKILHQS